MTELHFLGPDGALPRFPSRAELKRLASLDGPAHLDAFVYAAWQARNRIWILDLHFDMESAYPGLLQVLNGASMVRDVRIVSQRAKDKSDKAARLQAMRAAVDDAWNEGRPDTQRRRAPTTVRWFDGLVRNPSTYPFAHDRFAVVDDDLWHFGFSACGSGQSLSAASGPWSAMQTEAIAFFDDLFHLMSS